MRCCKCGISRLVLLYLVLLLALALPALASGVAPMITAFTPTSGQVGTLVTITGMNLATAPTVKVNGAAQTATVTVLTIVIAPGTTTGPITITTPGGTTTSATPFTVLQPPTITGFTPTSGGVGAVVKLTGTNFTGTNLVKFAGVTATTFSVISATSLTATVPAGAATGKISVTTPGGTATSAASFTVTQPPIFKTFSPTSGPVGTKVTLTGLYFSTMTAVKFNGVNAAFTATSDTVITTAVPAGAVTGKISVTTPGGTATSAASFTVTQPPTFKTFSPTSGPVGMKVTLTGQYFSTVSAVKFNGVNAGFSATSDAVITTTVPTGATTGKISIINPGGTVISASTFTITKSPPNINPKDGAAMVWVPGGNFLMGSTSADEYANSNEMPQHTVYLDGYWIYKNDVTVAQYQAFCTATLRTMPAFPTDMWSGKWSDYANYPMVDVTWYDATAYAAWAGVSLPTEAQWEKAARGTDGRFYPWGNTWDQTKCATWYNSGGSFAGVSHDGTWPVGSFPTGASPYGALDMAGNVWQWCADWYDAGYYATSPSKNPTGPASGTYSVLRGGSWGCNIVDVCRGACRGISYPSDDDDGAGFRCVSVSPGP